MTRKPLRVFGVGPEEGVELARPLNMADLDIFSETLDGRPRARDWKPIEMEIVHEDRGKHLRESDSPWLGSWALVFRQSATQALGELLAKEGELLSLECKEARLSVLNATNRLPALDENRSEVRRLKSGAIFAIDRHVFRGEVIGRHTAFKIASLRVSPTYVTQEFVDIWAGAGLRGLRFELLWDEPLTAVP
jgi:hypothetical protein